MGNKGANQKSAPLFDIKLLASLGTRVQATAIDIGIIVSFFIGLPMLLHLFFMLTVYDFADFFPALDLFWDFMDNYWLWLLLVVFIFIFARQESSPRRASFGKRIKKLEVCDAFGDTLSFKNALLRNALKYGLALVILYSFDFGEAFHETQPEMLFLTALVPVLFAFFGGYVVIIAASRGKYKQTVYDIVLNCFVVLRGFK